MTPAVPVEGWEKAAADARQRVYDSIPAAWRLPAHLLEKASSSALKPSDCEGNDIGILSEKDISITTLLDVNELLTALAQGVWTALEVTTAICKRAAIAHQCTSCLTCFFPQEALDRAGELDRYLKTEGKVVGPLHGLPVSFKDLYGIKGKPSSIGLVSWLGNIVADDSLCAKATVEAGGILFAKTGTSQACLMVESINNIFGAIRNPHNPALSAGGSSGGEAALIAAKGSIVGFGTDGGGSIRFPAMFCGLWGLKCSKGRLPGKGLASTYDGSESVNAGLGPMSQSVSGLEVMLQTQLDAEPWLRDPGCIPMPWKEHEAVQNSRKLRVGIILDDGVVEPVAPVMRSMQTVMTKLAEAGHELIELPVQLTKDLHRRGTASAMKSNVQNGGRSVMKHIEASGEPVVPRTAVGSAQSLLTSEEIFANHMDRAKIAGEYAEIWQTFQLDAILAPAVAHPAPPHGQYISNSYATMYNMLDYVAGSIPVTTVQETDMPGSAWLQKEPYPRIEPVRFPYDLGDEEMKKLFTCRWNLRTIRGDDEGARRDYDSGKKSNESCLQI
ncbi:uncharacterized protein LTR77_010249 [Saxophila tyrrhenica]|uniref:amidase n=1 Tax=Saxophila tyrrhenica TaxID=1690608 RepID=A0AAV9P0A0_9PEZI|nr:hypothetical protein LTR77_010249 [Saxophila tyrrhenica]